LRTDDEVEHLFVTTNHHWILFFTNKGRVYRAKAWQLPEAGRDAKGGHVCRAAVLLAGRGNRARCCHQGLFRGAVLVAGHQARPVKKTVLPAYDSPGRPGLLPVNFREEDDELIGAELSAADDEVLLISRKGLSIRFPADDSELRPMGRATSGRNGNEVPAEVMSCCRCRSSGPAW
jgi:DNA gyrase subunit A